GNQVVGRTWSKKNKKLRLKDLHSAIMEADLPFSSPEASPKKTRSEPNQEIYIPALQDFTPTIVKRTKSETTHFYSPTLCSSKPRSKSRFVNQWSFVRRAYHSLSEQG
ncbi:hypothetical protein L195_g020278, partial [Trifolium pratense]